MNQTEEPIIIQSEEAKRWYNFGFLFALNYVYAKLPEANKDVELNKAEFKEYINNRYTRGGKGVIDEGFFVDYPFTGNNPYGLGMCPGDLPNTCIPCTARGVEPLPIILDEALLND